MKVEEHAAIQRQHSASTNEVIELNSTLDSVITSDMENTDDGACKDLETDIVVYSARDGSKVHNALGESSYLINEVAGSGSAERVSTFESSEHFPEQIEIMMQSRSQLFNKVELGIEATGHESPNITQIERKHNEAEQRRQTEHDEAEQKREREHNEAEQKRQNCLIQQHQEEIQDSLVQCVMQAVGFNNDRPIAAYIIYESLLQWRSFEAEKTDLFDKIIQAIGFAIESQDNNNALAYWLSNTSTLLFLLQRSLNFKAGGSAGGTPHRRQRSNFVTWSERTTLGYRASPQPSAVSFGNGGRILSGKVFARQVEAKYPALLFKQQLTAYMGKIYGMVRDNLKMELSTELGLCIRASSPASRTSKASLGKISRSPSSNATGRELTLYGQRLSSHWHSIISSLSSMLSTMRANHVPPFLVRKLFAQSFSFINEQLFNSLLVRRECCSFSNGEYVKGGLAELEHWIHEAGEEYAGASWDELKPIRQAVEFLVVHQKRKKTLDEITRNLCPVLSILQLRRIVISYWDDKYGTHSISREVVSNMGILMTEDSKNSGSNIPYLLEADSSISFSEDDVLESIPEVDVGDVEPPRLLKDNPAFRFLMPHRHIQNIHGGHHRWHNIHQQLERLTLALGRGKSKLHFTFNASSACSSEW